MEFEYGDKIICEGEFTKGNSQRNYGGFDYAQYLKSIKIYGVLTASNIQKVSENNFNIVKQKIYDIKNSINKNIEKIFKGDHIDMVKGLILGNTKGLNEEIEKDFQITNISHVLAISGMHVVYIVIGIEKSFGKILGKRKVNYLIIIVLIFYMAITDFTSSIVRAGIMGIMTTISFLIYRKKDIWTPIAVSLLIILIENPYAIMQVGLQLSYLGTIGIIIFNPTVKRFLDNIKFIKNKDIKIIETVKEILSVTISAQLMIFPIMIYHFNILGIYFIIANLLVSIIIGPITIISIVCIIFSFINLTISKCFSIFLSCGIESLIQISKLSNLPFSKIYIPTPKISTICVYYILVLLFNKLYIIYTNKKNTNTEKRVKNIISLFKYKMYQNKQNIIFACKNVKDRKNYLLLFSKIYKVIIILVIFIVTNFLNQRLEIYFLDIGQGDSCFIITPKNKTILIDGGGSMYSSFDVGESTLLPYILDRGFSKIDYIFISHFDQDHIGGIFTILQELKVGKIYISEQKEESQNYKKFLEIVQEKQIDVNIVRAGNKIIIDDIQFSILWPEENYIQDNILNNNAIVMKLIYNNFSMLFTGDIEEIAEKKIVDKYKNSLNSTILKVAHHGSKTSSIESFLKSVKCKIALIGVGENNNFGHPSEIVLDRLRENNSKIYRTDEYGEISIIVHKNGNFKINTKCIN